MGDDANTKLVTKSEVLLCQNPKVTSNVLTDRFSTIRATMNEASKMPFECFKKVAKEVNENYFQEEMKIPPMDTGSSLLALLKIDIRQTEFAQNYTDYANSKVFQCTPDGNCLFNAISLLLIGDESLSAELRLRTCTEMATNQGYYENTHRTSGFELFSDSYEVACINCSKLYEESSVWTMAALATVIKVPIVSVYGRWNGKDDHIFKKLNITLTPRSSKDNDSKGSSNTELWHDQLHVLWTGMGYGGYNPNHFNPLVPFKKQDLQQSVQQKPLVVTKGNKMQPGVQKKPLVVSKEKTRKPDVQKKPLVVSKQEHLQQSVQKKPLVVSKKHGLGKSWAQVAESGNKGVKRS